VFGNAAVFSGLDVHIDIAAALSSKACRDTLPLHARLLVVCIVQSSWLRHEALVELLSVVGPQRV
jgi:hypothetical protein